MMSNFLASSEYRTHHCGELCLADIGTMNRVVLSGWVHRKRDHGGLMFIDLRDNSGIMQLVIPAELAEKLSHVRQESVIRVRGDLAARAPEAVNPNLNTGQVEVRVTEYDVLSEAAELPIPVFQKEGDAEYPEELRLKYRYLDLRRDKLHANMKLRSDVIAYLRDQMYAAEFREFQTPILTASSPEGARDFLVPSRLHPGKFYALPQAPQQFKQLLMVSGFDRYFQIAPCFRDEAARADRSPGEFYQLDIEMSFVGQNEVFRTIEPIIEGVFDEFKPEGWPTADADDHQDFPRIPYREAIRKYGSDKPDLRNPIEMQDCSAIFRDANFKLFHEILHQQSSPENEIWGIPAVGGSASAFCNSVNSWAQSTLELPGMGYVAWREDGAAGPIAKAIGPEKAEQLREQFSLNKGDALFFITGNPYYMAKNAGLARTFIGEKLNLIEQNVFKFCWIVDFPMYEEEEPGSGKIVFSHNPFSMPQGGMEAIAHLGVNDPRALDVLAYQYDIVCNGVELSSGAIRNHKPEVMLKAFEIAGYKAEEVEKEFGGMLNAFRYGAPPHGGIAPGIDRIVMLLAEAKNLREVIAFPLDQQGRDLMLNAPSEVKPQQLRDVHIRTL